MTRSTTPVAGSPRNWLGFDDPFPQASSFASIPRVSAAPDAPHAPPFRALLSNQGDRTATLRSDLRFAWTSEAFVVHAELFVAGGAAIDRLETIRKRPVGNAGYSREEWGDDALELQIDVGLTRTDYAHFIFTPMGTAVTYRGFSNRQTQGYHPPVNVSVRIDHARGCWLIDASIPFAGLGSTPCAGNRWGFNIMRVDPDERGAFSQWSPTFGDALRPECFGIIEFTDHVDTKPLHGDTEITAYHTRFQSRDAYLRERFAGVTSDEVLRELDCPDWQTWARRAASPTRPKPVRWEHWAVDEVPAFDHATAMELARRAATHVDEWNADDPPRTALRLLIAEPIADAFLLTRDPSWARVAEKMFLVHDARWRLLFTGKAGHATYPNASHDHAELTHDSQISEAAFVARPYLIYARENLLSPRVHEIAMTRLLRAGRFAAFNIETAYCYGNHQVYEAGGLAQIAALFPEFRESQHWADVASRTIRTHFQREVYADGGYMERCGYHAVALTFAAQGLAAVTLNGQQHRFKELVADDTLAAFDRMYRWVAAMLMPDGTMPPFGDFRAVPLLRLLAHGAALRNLPDVLGHVRRLAPQLVPPALRDRATPVPALSYTLGDSQFTMMRDSLDARAMQMAVEHGPLGGEHSHVDNMGFVAHAFGEPILVDPGMGLTYGDFGHKSFYRKAEAHNVVTIDDRIPEKVARRVSWRTTPKRDTLVMQSDAYLASHGVRHERTIVFEKGLAWIIFDRLKRVDVLKPMPTRYDLHLHATLKPALSSPPLWIGRSARNERVGAAFAVIAGRDAGTPQAETVPASWSDPRILTMRLHDSPQLYPDTIATDSQWLRWRMNADEHGEAWFVALVAPFEGKSPTVVIDSCDAHRLRVRINGRLLEIV